SYYDQAQTGELLTRLTNDVEQVRTFVGQGVVQFGASALMLVGVTVLMFLMNAPLAAAALGAIAPILLVLGWFVRKMGPLFGKIQITIGRLNTALQEALRGIRVVRAFSAEPREMERYGSANIEMRDWGVSLIGVLSTNFPMVNLFANLGTLTVV